MGGTMSGAVILVSKFPLLFFVTVVLSWLREGTLVIFRLGAMTIALTPLLILFQISCPFGMGVRF